MAVDADSPDGELNESTTATPESDAATDTEGVPAEDIESDAADYDAEVTDPDTQVEDVAEKHRRFAMSHTRLAVVAGLVVVLALGGLVGWLGFRAYESRQAEEQSRLFLQAARQGAINLTTLDWQDADAGVQRILDSATGTFYDDFSQRSQPFVDVLTKTQSKTEGTVTEAGVESISGDQAQVLVAMKVLSSNMAAPEQDPRFWRMRLAVQKVSDDEAKVANVTFVP